LFNVIINYKKLKIIYTKMLYQNTRTTTEYGIWAWGGRGLSKHLSTGEVTIENVEEHAGVLTNKCKHCMGEDAPEAYSSPGPYYITTPKGRIAK
jgi:hypothetical protein